MKIYKQILEAVNKGIQIALDDFDDIESIGSISPKGDVIDSESTIKNTIEYNKELNNVAVDLGLPSGTLWCKLNLGASETSNLEDWYGDYYAWGEIHTKHIYSWGNYKWCKILHKNLTKYCCEPEYGNKGFTDNITKLQDSDNVVIQTMKSEHDFQFNMPSKKQFEELLNYTTHKWVKDYKHINGLNGLVFTGRNKNKLFMPACGYFRDEQKLNPGKMAQYWTLDLADKSLQQATMGSGHSCGGCAFSFWKFERRPLYVEFEGLTRCNGNSIRPVINFK